MNDIKTSREYLGEEVVVMNRESIYKDWVVVLQGVVFQETLDSVLVYYLQSTSWWGVMKKHACWVNKKGYKEKIQIIETQGIIKTR